MGGKASGDLAFGGGRLNRALARGGHLLAVGLALVGDDRPVERVDCPSGPLPPLDFFQLFDGFAVAAEGGFGGDEGVEVQDMNESGAQFDGNADLLRRFIIADAQNVAEAIELTEAVKAGSILLACGVGGGPGAGSSGYFGKCGGKLGSVAV